MYTVCMSRSFRTLAIGLTMLWIVAPQIACFMPDAMTETEQQCCKEMASDCSGSGMSHECCRRVVRADAATVTATNRGIVHDFSLAEKGWESGASSLLNACVGDYPSGNESPPVDSVPSLVILRI